MCAYTALVEWTPSKIRSERIARGWSQKQLAEALRRSAPDFKISLRTVTAWETDEATPSEKNIAALERVFTTDTAADDGDATLRGFTYLQLVSEQARRFADLEAENQALRAEVQTLRAGTDNRPQSGRHGTFPDHLYPPQSGNRVNSDG